MAARSTTSQFYPAPPGKLLARQGNMRNAARYAALQKSASEGRRKRRNMSTVPQGRTGSALTGYSGTLTFHGFVPTITG
jgi:hypothetical protein